MPNYPELIKNPVSVLEHLFMEPVSDQGNGQYYISAYEDDIFDVERLLQLHRLYPEADIVLYFSPDAENSLYDSYQLIIATDPDHPWFDPDLDPFNYKWSHQEGIIHWYMLRDTETSLYQKIGQLQMPESFFVSRLRMAYHELDESIVPSLFRKFTYVNHNNQTEYKMELATEFLELRKQGIYRLFSEPGSCLYCHPGKQTWNFYCNSSRRFLFSLIVIPQPENCFLVRKCLNEPSEEKEDTDLPF